MLLTFLTLTFIPLKLALATSNAACSITDTYNQVMNQELSSGHSGINSLINNGKELGPTRDQDSVGWCYAFTAADLAQHWLAQHPNVNFPRGEQLSPIPFAINYERYEGEILSYNSALQRHILFQNQEYSEISNEINSQLEEYKEKRDELYDSAAKGKDITEELESVKKAIQYYTLLEKSLHQSVARLPNVPEGGYTALGIYAPGKRLCLESEINSRDDVLSEAALSYQNIMMDSNLLNSAPEKIQLNEVFQGLSYASIAKDEQVRCDFYGLVNQVFPQMTQDGLSSLWAVVQEMKPYEDIFKEIIDRACTEKAGLDTALNSMSLKIQRQSQNLPVEDNSKLFGQIDDTLENGYIAAVSYRSSIFSTKKPSNSTNDYHESVITGSLEICGKKHYILRNSWGEQACQTKRAHFQGPQNIQQQISEMDSLCRTQANTEIIQTYGDLKCEQVQPEQRDACLLHRSELLSQCSTLANSVREEHTPFTCDDQGNFIVSKEQLAIGLYGVTSPEADNSN